jgi:uncharacterized membrane protein YhhN
VNAFAACAIWTALWLLPLLAAERSASPRAARWIWIAKPLASTGFVAAALRGGVPGTAQGAWLLAGLALSLLGDVLLIPRSTPRAFLFGIAAFGTAHAAYAAAFAARGLEPVASACGALAMLAFGALVARWLSPHLTRPWRAPVFAYVAAIGVMVALAAGAAAGAPALLAGAVLFAVSDLSVARDRFVAPGFANAAWGLPLYYAAQLVLASQAA